MDIAGCKMASNRELEEVFIVSYEALYEVITMVLEDIENNKYLDAHSYIEKAIEEKYITMLKI